MTNPRSPRADLFVVVGMPRGATTFLYHNLQRHPEIFLPARKEVNYFNIHHGDGVEWYRDQYLEAGPHQVKGDISPPCFMDPESPRRILEHDPEARAILVVRDPVDWALSFYAQFSSFNFVMPSFSEYLDGYRYEMTEGSLGVRFRDGAIVEAIERFRRAFGDQLLIYDYSHFEHDRLDVLRALESFLGLDPWFASGNFDDMRINASSRRNAKAVSWLLSREWFIRAVQRSVPAHVIKSVRGRFDRFNASNEPGKYVHPERHVVLAEEALADQRDAIVQLFAAGPIVLGDGTPFSMNTRAELAGAGV